MLKRIAVFALLAFIAALPVAAQMAPSAPAKEPFSAGLKAGYDRNKDFLVRAAEKMPEENYGMRPGAQTEVRTFGQLVGHLANLNYSYCSRAKGEKNPNAGNDFEKKTTKADLVKALHEALAYCDGVYSALTDAKAVEVVKTTGPNNREIQSLPGLVLVQNFAHNNEHYGNIVTYMRIKGIVPPSSEAQPRAGGN